jgi:hypothetical protein
MAVKSTSKTSAKPAAKPAEKSTAKKSPELLGQMIRDRAYYIWEAKGRPSGAEMAIWLEAEKDVLRKQK